MAVLGCSGFLVDHPLVGVVFLGGGVAAVGALLPVTGLVGLLNKSVLHVLRLVSALARIPVLVLVVALLDAVLGTRIGNLGIAAVAGLPVFIAIVVPGGGTGVVIGIDIAVLEATIGANGP